MVKALIKETVIMALLCVAIVLLLGFVFYDYIPSNKAIPNKLATYQTPENIQEKIDEEIVEEEKENVTYTITGSDLNLYKQTNSYVSGKANPFSASIINNGNNTNGENTTGSTTNEETSSGNTGTATDPNSTGTFFHNSGLK